MLASLQAWYPNLPLNIPLLRKATAGTGKFCWTPALEAEYLAVKEIMVTQIRLSPYDKEKKLRLIIDGASSLGVGYVLFQYLNDQDPGVANKICDCLSRLCRAVTKTHHYPLPTPRLLPMSKRASVHAKQLETQDPLVADLAVAGAACPAYIAMLNDIENRTPAKELQEDSELRNISGLLKELGTVVMPDGTRLIVRDGTEILVPVGERQRILETLHLTHSLLCEK